MSYADDAMIAAEDAATDVQPVKTAEEMTQVMRVLDRVDQTPTLAALPDFSTTHDPNEGCVMCGGPKPCPDHPPCQTFAAPRFVPDPESVRRFNPPRDLPSALDEGQLTRAAWGTMNVGHPVVVAALEMAEDAEGLSRKYGARYRCEACHMLGTLETFPWAGALFVHLLTCPHFAADVNGDV